MTDTATLASAFAAVEGEIPHLLVSARAAAALRHVSRTLPSLPILGLEVRLGDEERVDLQQCVRTPADRAATRRCLPSAARLLDAWEHDTALTETVEEVWLEHDCELDGSSALSVLVGFTRDSPARPSLVAATHFLALESIVGEVTVEAMKGCFAACSGPERVSHVGAMVGRPSPFVRINLKSVRVERLAPILRQIGWSGDIERGEETFRLLDPIVDHVTVALDLPPAPARLGFECLIDAQPPSTDRWRMLLDQLGARGWSTPAKGDALLRFGGAVTPVPDRPWPASFVRDELLLGQHALSHLEKQVSHVKVTLQPEGAVEAKAYFGFAHRMLFAAADAGEHPPSVSPRRGTRPRDTVARGVEFLAAVRTAAGWWREFGSERPPGSTGPRGFAWADEWVTAYTGVALAGTGVPAACVLARDGWRLLSARRPAHDGWAYNRETAVDCDSTSWALLLARALGIDGSERAVALVNDHRCDDGGFTTYREETCPLPPAMAAGSRASDWQGWWNTSHACVTATVAMNGDQGAVDYLERTQRADGGWDAYWWADDAYAVAFATEAIASRNRHARALGPATRWALARLGPDGSVDGSAFATALVLRTLRRAAPEAIHPIEAAAAWLRGRQERDGSWEASAILLAPRADLSRSGGIETPGAWALDSTRTFTTATVLTALAGLR